MPLPSNTAAANHLKYKLSVEDEMVPLRLEDFSIHDFLAKGGMGAVYRGTRKVDQLKVALKFFGYDEKCPDMDSIQLEVAGLTALRGLDGVVPLIGTFMDTASGILGKKSYKIWPKRYPVLVMPLLEGGALIDRIHVRSRVTENDLKHWFKEFIIGLGNIHLKGYIHRDIKLENIMLECMAEDSPVRIIDFGLVAKLPATGDILVSHKISGTRGYHAPETLKWKHYSPRSDIWQAGCCLYSMLSGYSPFHPDNDSQALDAKYSPMIGPVWSSISDRAKDLVSRILVADPDKRITISDILQHPWMTSDAPQNDLGGDYVARIKHLALRQRIKGFFLQDSIGESNKVKRDHLVEILPFLKPPTLTKFSSYVSINSDSRSPPKFKIMRNGSSTSLSSGHKGSEHGMGSYSSHSTFNSPTKSQYQTNSDKSAVEFNNKLQIFQDLVIESFREKYLRANDLDPAPLSPMSIGSIHPKDDPSSLPRSQSLTPLSKLRIEYNEFAELLTRAGLAQLADPTVFSIFETTNSGGIDLKEFLFTMLAFHTEDDSVAALDTSSDRSLQTIRMYFHIFDLHGSGQIQLDDFKLAVSCLLENRQVLSSASLDTSDHRILSSSSHPTSNSLHSLENNLKNIEELFVAIDTDKNGSIGFGEFKEFYDAILSTTSRTGTVVSLS